MTAKIDIKTPAGKSLEGFPITFPVIDDYTCDIANVITSLSGDGQGTIPALPERKLHSGDTITIEIL